MSFARRLDGAATYWAATKVLLERWRQAVPDAPARHERGRAGDRWADLVRDAREHFSTPQHLDADGQLSPADRARILEWTDDGSDLDAVHAVAWGIDEAASLTFAVAWRDELCNDGVTRHVMRPGALYPVAEPPWTMQDGVGHSARPSSLTPPRIDELPHVRARDDDGFEVVADFGLDEELDPIVRNLKRVATLHPNQGLDEFVMLRPSETSHSVFPVRVSDENTQLTRVLELLDRAIEAGARIVVLPELSTTAGIVDAVRTRLDDLDRAVLVAAGSYHAEVDGTPGNHARGLISDCVDELQHAKLVPFIEGIGTSAPMKEGIAPPAPPRVIIYHAREFRVCLQICKDFLDKDVGDVLDRLGANVICVPAMSAKSHPFVGRARTRVDNAQALSVVANGPVSWSDSVEGSIGREPVAIVGQPVSGHETTAAPKPGEPFTAPDFLVLATLRGTVP